MEIKPIIEKDALARLLGGDEFDEIPRSTRSKINQMNLVFEELVEPNLCHRNMGIDSVEKGAVLLEEGQKFKSNKLSKTLKNCDEIICYIATLGDSIEDRINQLMQKKHLAQAYILDAMASVAADNMVETFHQQMKDVYNDQNKQVTLCFSPGYCDWPLTDQKKLFGIFDSNELDVELTDSCFMKPRKSISGVFGITPPDSNHREQSYNPCSECNRPNCSARRL
ncbi:MAG: hypothetical protein LJE66_01725 [Desulfobacterales bacterium]|jgi:hypothetical protein|nr:hypothetical protein [Desulfobacterales bacterium]